jgi:hypothetical protein
MQPSSIYTSNKLTNTFGYICRSKNSNSVGAIAITFSLYIYNIVILLGAGYMSYLTRSVSESFSESVFMVLIVTGMALVGITIIPVINLSDMSTNVVLSRKVVIWLMTTFTLVLFFGSKVLALYLHNFTLKNQNMTWTFQRLNLRTKNKVGNGGTAAGKSHRAEIGGNGRDKMGHNSVGPFIPKYTVVNLVSKEY